MNRPPHGFDVVLVTLLWLTSAAPLMAQQTTGAQTSPLGPSSIEVPVRISLDPLAVAAEKHVPEQTGYWRGWHDWHGIDTQYRAWRGPLRVRMRGDMLLLEAHVRYWIKARKRVLNAFELEGSCGIDEPPRQAVIGLMARLRWGPDWRIYPQFKILPTRFLDPCEMTAAQIDVTPVVEEVFQQQMEKGLRTTLRALLPELDALRQQADDIWSQLQQPVHLAGDNWLLLRPAGVALSPLRGQNRTLDTKLALIFYPKIGTKSETAFRPRPLPPLGQFYPRSPGLSMRLLLELGFADLSRQISTALAAQSFVFEDRVLKVENVVLSGKGQELDVKAAITGDASGSLETWADLVFTPDAQRLELKDLEFIFEPDDPADAMLSELFYLKIRESLETTANQLLAHRLGGWRQQLESLFRDVLPNNVTVDFSTLNLNSVKIEMNDTGINLEGVASGRTRMTFR